MENTIQIAENNVLRFNVKKENGEDTGVVIKFDLQDIEMPLRISKMYEIHEKNVSLLKQKAMVIEKQEDKKGKGLLTWKQEELIKLFSEFYDNDIKALDMLIGQGMTKKILKAIERYPYYDMFDDIVNSLQPALSRINKEADDMFEDIKKKYGAVENGNTI